MHSRQKKTVIIVSQGYRQHISVTVYKEFLTLSNLEIYIHSMNERKTLYCTREHLYIFLILSVTNRKCPKNGVHESYCETFFNHYIHEQF